MLALPDFFERADTLARGGGVALHVRSASLTASTLLDVSRRLVGTGAPVFVNDRIDLVPHAQAAGVHVPARGLSVRTARRLLGPSLLIGCSVHGPDEARRAHDEGADYVFLGPVWETPSHPGASGIGVEAIAAAAPARVVAIGGITPERAAECVDAGAWGVAAITALWFARDPRSAADSFLLCLRSGDHHHR